MTVGLVEATVVAAQALLTLAMGFALFRIMRGPRAQDRVVGLDSFYVNGMLLLVTIGVRTGSTLYFEVSLVIALLGFASTMAFSKFLMRGVVIE